MTEEARLNYEIYQLYKNTDRAKWEKQVIDDLAFMSGQMWTTADQKEKDSKGQVAPITNEIIPTINLVVAELTNNAPRFYAYGRERSDAKTASAYADTMSYIWDISDGDEKNDQHTVDFESIGMGVWFVYVDTNADSGKGEIKLESINPLYVYFSPTCKNPNGKDSEHILIVNYLSEELVKLYYPDIDTSQIISLDQEPKLNSDRYAVNDQILFPADTGTRKFRLIDRYTKIKQKRYNIYDPESAFERTMTEKQYIDWAQEKAVIVTKLGQEHHVIDNPSVNEFLGIIQNYGNIYHLYQDPVSGQPQMRSGVEDGELAIPNSTTQLTVVTKGQLVEEKKLVLTMPLVDRIKRVFSVGDEEVDNRIIEIEDYPIIATMHHHFRNPFPQGDIRLVKDLQQQLNTVDSLIITYHQNIAEIMLALPKGSGIKKEIESAEPGRKVFEYDPELGGVPIVIQMQQLGSSFFAHRQNIINQIQRIVGAYSIMDSQMQMPETFRGTITMDEMMQRRTAYKRKKLERSLNSVASVIAQMIPLIYTKEKVIRIVQPNHAPKEVTLNQPVLKDDGTIDAIMNDMSIGRYDVKMVSGSMLPTNKTQRREEKIRYYELGILKDPEWVIRELDEPDVEEILQRESLLNQMTAQMQSLMEENKKLKGDLQTADRETVQANQKVEIMKTKTELQNNLNKASNQLTSLVEQAKHNIKTEVKNGKDRSTR